MFSVPVDDALCVQKAQPRDNLGGVETSPGLWKSTRLLDVEHEIASIQVLHHEKQMRLKQQQ